MTSHMQRGILDTCSECGARQRHYQNGLMSTKSKDAKPVAGILCVDIHILAEVAIAFGCPLFTRTRSLLAKQVSFSVLKAVLCPLIFEQSCI